MQLRSLKVMASILLFLGLSHSAALFALVPTDPPLFFTPEPSAVPQVLAAINGAQTSFHMQMYRISEPTIIDALIAAHGRGVDVQVILDQNALANEKPTGAYHRLSEANVKVFPSSSAFSLSHQKTFVVDGKTAYIMTLNLTTITPKTRDVGYITTNPAVVQFMENLFRVDVENAANATMVSPEVIPEQFILSPVNSRARLEALIVSAKKSVMVTVENFSDTVLMKALVDAHKKGVVVEVIMPRCDLTGNDFDMPAARQLHSGGVSVRMMPAPMAPELPYIHQKSMVIDGERAYLGSENFTFNSLDFARELGIIISELPKVHQLVEQFNEDFAKSLVMKDAEAFACPEKNMGAPPVALAAE